MAGYSGFYKSNNAVDAESRGLTTASATAKALGLKKATTVQEFMPAVEWHHTSKWYNKVDYYDLDDATPELVARMKEAEAQDVQSASFLAVVEFVEWRGSRNRPVAINHKGTTTITIKGQFATFELDGQQWRKKIGGNHFFYQKCPERN